MTAYNIADLSAFGQFFTAGINDQGEIVSAFSVNIGSDSRVIGYFLNGAALTTFGLDTQPNMLGFSTGDINNSGEIVGTIQNGTFINQTVTFTGVTGFFTNSPQPVSTISGFAANGINDSGVIVGSGGVYNKGVITPLSVPNAAPNTTVAMGINDAGTIVGYYQDSAGKTHGFIYQNSTFTTVDDPNGNNNTYLTAINDSGTIVGYYRDLSDVLHFTHGLVYNGSTFTTLDDGQNTELTGINNNGVIVGTAGYLPTE
jgi:probable HAF family extracellular repeat protein